MRLKVEGIYSGMNRKYDLTSNKYMTITLYMTCNTFICTILLGLLESSNITVSKDFIHEIIEFKVTEKCKKKAFFRDFGLNFLSD